MLIVMGGNFYLFIIKKFKLVVEILLKVIDKMIGGGILGEWNFEICRIYGMYDGGFN